MTAVRDNRRHDFTIIDNEVITDYLPIIGVHAFAVYAYLAKIAAQKDHTCVVRHKTMAKALGIGISTVKRSLDTLAGEDTDSSGVATIDRANLSPLITIDQRFDEDGSPLANSYTLLNVSKRGQNDDTPGPQETEGQSTQNRGSVPTELHINTSLNQEPSNQEKELPPPRQTTFSESATLDEKWITGAEKQGIPREAVSYIFEQFKYYWVGKGERRQNWYATWIQWCMKPYALDDWRKSQNTMPTPAKPTHQMTAMELLEHRRVYGR